MGRHDITDEKWAIIRPILAKGSTENRGRKRKDSRLMFNAILWIMKTGAPWRDLHLESGPWKTVHKRFLKWVQLEVWDNILKMLSVNADPESIIIDAAFIRLHQTGAKGDGSIKESGRSKGGLTTRSCRYLIYNYLILSKIFFVT